MGQVALGYDQELTADDGTGYGLACSSDRTNRVPVNASTDQDLVGSAVWDKGGAAGVTFNAVDGPEGFRDGIRLIGSNAANMRLDLGNIAVSAAANQRAVWFARADVAHSARAKLLDGAGLVKETYDYAVTTTWARIDHLFTTWDNATANCILQFFASDDATSRTLYLAGPFYFGEVTKSPALIPSSSAPLSMAAAIADAQPVSFNSEGEIVVEALGVDTVMNATLVRVDNGANNNDRRDVGVDGSDAVLVSFDATGTDIDSNIAGTDYTALFTLRGRWNRAGLLDAAAAFAGVVAGDDLAALSDYGRAATFTASAVPAARVLIGNGTDKLDGLIRRVEINTRESRLPKGP